MARKPSRWTTLSGSQVVGSQIAPRTVAASSRTRARTSRAEDTRPRYRPARPGAGTHRPGTGTAPHRIGCGAGWGGDDQPQPLTVQLAEEMVRSEVSTRLLPASTNLLPPA